MQETVMKVASACLLFASAVMMMLGRSDTTSDSLDHSAIPVAAASNTSPSGESDTLANEFGGFADPLTARDPNDVLEKSEEEPPSNHSLDTTISSATFSKATSSPDHPGESVFRTSSHTIRRDPSTEGHSPTALTKRPNSRVPSPILHVGRMGENPSVSKIRTIKELPVYHQNIRAAYYNAAEHACAVLSQGTPVTSIGAVTSGSSGRYGRVHALTIGLELDDAGRDKLPKITVDQIVKYFDQHGLAVQPMLLHSESGHVFFANETKAAFFERRHPTSTRQPEPMIDAAIARFRGLGIAPAANERVSQGPGIASGRPVATNAATTSDLGGRTLVMAFVFEQNSLAITGSARSKYVHELMLLHLPLDFDPSNPRIEVFLTQNERQELHRLRQSTPALAGAVADITAKVRFGKTTLMGMYPAEPIVTDIRFASGGSVPITQLMDELSGGAISVSTVLDHFDSHVQSNSVAMQPADSTMEDADPDVMKWLHDARLSKEREFESVFGPDAR